MNILNVLYHFVPFIVLQNPLLNSSTNREKRQTGRHIHMYTLQTVEKRERIERGGLHVKKSKREGEIQSEKKEQR